jgi:uncharacterized RDD family membrane protein YckC
MKRTGFKGRWGRAGLAVALAAAWVTVSPVQAQPEAAADAEAPETQGPVARPAKPRSIGEVVNVFNATHLKAGQRAELAVTVFRDSRVDGDVDDVCVTVFGNATVNGRVGSECVTVFGDLDLNSEVEGELVVVMGQARLGPRAVVHGDTIVVGGRLTADPEATLHGQKLEVAGFLPAIGDWFRYGLFWGRPFPPTVGWVWFVVGLHFLLYLLVAALLSRPVESCERVLEAQALPAFGIGLLGLILSAPLSFVLLVSGVGLLILPFVAVAAVAALVIGKAALFQWIGRSICRRFNTAGTCPPLLGFAAGFGIVSLLYMVPLLGFVFYGLFIPLAFGAAIMAVAEVIRANRAAKAPPSLPGMPAPGSSAAMDTAAGADATGTTLAFGTPAAAATSLVATGAAAAAEFASMPRAGFWIRTAAVLLDFILLGWVFAALSFPAFLPLWIAYHVGMWTWKGTTIGGIVCGLKVVRLDLRRLDFTVALVRSLAAVFSTLPLLIGFFWAGWSAEKQSWHDKIAGTVIVKVPRGVSLI